VQLPGASLLSRRAWGALQIARASRGRLAIPLKVNLCVTYWCQYRCKTCNIWRRRPVDELSTDELLAFIRKNRDIAWLDVTGGEIFLRKDISDILEAIVRTWPRLSVLHFPTNGFLTEAIAAAVGRIAGRGAYRLIVTVSLDGDEALNDEVRGVKGGFRRQIDTFKAIRRLRGVEAVLGMTLSAHNLDAVDRTFEACRRECPDLSPNDLHLNLAQISDHYYGNAGDAGLAPRGDAREVMRRYRATLGMPRSLSDWVERAFLKELDAFLDTGRTPMRCHALRSSCFIDPWGGVLPCITWNRPLGSLRETGMDLAPIWRSDQAAALQHEVWEGRCPQCWTACEAYQSILGNAFRGRS
jgi:MoaA/NifB/PqqE/SkfB family radical SAM enzyme